MDLIRNINDAAREKDAAEAAVAETEPQEDKGKTVSDYLSDIQGEEKT